MIAIFHARTALIAIALVGTWATAARAGCLSDGLEQVTPQLAAVSSPEARAYFIQGAEKAGCPSNGAACRAHAYVVPNDTVVVTKVVGGYACAVLTNSKGTTTENWLPASALRMLAPTQPVSADWLGHWRTGDQAITISAASYGMLAVKGEATFGSHDPDRVRRGAVNTGEVEGTIAPRGDLLAFVQGDDGKTLPFSDSDDTACRIKMQLSGPYLWAWENGCGGMGVSFIGAYSRVSR